MPNSDDILTCSGDMTIRRWDSSTGEERAVCALSVSGHPKMHMARFSPDAKQIAVELALGNGSLCETSTGDRIFDYDCSIRRFESEQKKLLTLRPRLWFSPNGHHTVTTKDMTAHLRSRDRTTMLQLGHSDLVTWGGFSPDNKLALTTSLDKTAILWNAATGHSQKTLMHTDPVLSGSFSPDGRFLLTVSIHGEHVVWDPRDGRRLYSQELHPAVSTQQGWTGNSMFAITSSATLEFDNGFAASGGLQVLAVDLPRFASLVAPRALTSGERAKYLIEMEPEAN